MSTNAVVTSIKDPKKLTPKQRWESEINAAKKEKEEFIKRAKLTTKRYQDERDASTSMQKRFNVFWANTNIMKSALYSQIPKASVSRRYTDYRDDVARVAALVLERTLQQDLNDPNDCFDGVMRQAVFDRLVPGLACAWLRLETDTEDIPESEGGQISDDSSANVPGPKGKDDGFPVPPAQRITQQRVAIDYVHWDDFFWSPCRTWAERRWVARGVCMDYDRFKARFGEDKAKLTSFSTNPTKIDEDNQVKLEQNIIEQAYVYEIWDRQTRKCIWFSPSCSEILDEKDDYLKLTSFEPCPMPMFANVVNDRLMPRPDFYMVQDQYYELDQLNQRISKINEAIKVIGVFDKGNYNNLNNMLAQVENTLIPVDNWAVFAEKGGLEGVISWLPLADVIAAQERLMRAREEVKAQIYELTGISDIVRGASKASETLGAQEIKAQFASVRIKDLQDEVARFATDILRIKGEIQVKHFTPELLIEKSGIIYTDNDEFVPQAIALLKSEAGFNWRVKIEPGSMAQADYALEKKDAIEFMSAASSFIGQAMPMASQIPEIKPVILGLFKWGIARFHNAADIEGMIDRQLTLLEGKPPAPPPPDPKVQTEQLKQQTMQQQAQIDMQKAQADIANEQKRMELDAAQKQQEMTFAERMAQMEMQMKEAELLYKKLEMEMKMNFSQQEFEQQMQRDQVQGAIEIEGKQQEMALKREQGEQDLVLNAARGEQELAQGEAAHEASLKQGEEMTKAKVKAASKTKKAD
jgi:hypothetical protein